MSVTTKVVVAGTVADSSSRSGIAKATGEVWERHTIVVIGGGVIAEVSFRDKSVFPPSVGTEVCMLCEVGVYRDDDTLDFSRYLDAKLVSNGK